MDCTSPYIEAKTLANAKALDGIDADLPSVQHRQRLARLLAHGGVAVADDDAVRAALERHFPPVERRA